MSKAEWIVGIGIAVLMALAMNLYGIVATKYMEAQVEVEVEPQIIEVEEVTEEEIADQEYEFELEELAILVQAEAGNQDLKGKRLVVDVVLNRVDSDRFPNSIHDVIYQKNQFSTITDGAYDKAMWEVTDECFEAVRLELEERLDYEILFFTAGNYNKYCKPMYKYQDHYFGN